LKTFKYTEIQLEMKTLVPKTLHSIKKEIRILGIDDGRFVPRTKGLVDLIGIVYRGGCWFEGIMRTKITIDGLDATEKIASMIMDSRHYGELRIVVLDGVTFAGFNVVDISKLSSSLILPVISVTREKPKLQEIRSALTKLPDFNKRWEALMNAGKLFRVQTQNGNPVYINLTGINYENAEEIIKKTSTHSNIPEALRVAHIVASGLTR
jgi:endonuclease V-like protein UPF0215 family